MDTEMQEFLGDIEYVVEATHAERSFLWERWHCNFENISWEDQSLGYLLAIGELAEMPVCISVHKSKILGHWVLFWELTSQVQDYRMARDWLKENVVAFSDPEGPRARNTDVDNFFHCIHHLLDKNGDSMKNHPRIWDLMLRRPAN